MPAGAKHEYKEVDLHDKSPEFVELYRKVVQDPAANAKVNDGCGRESRRAGWAGAQLQAGSCAAGQISVCQKQSHARM